MTIRFDMTGQRFNRLLVIEHAGKNKQGESLWLCQCDCGNIITVRRSCLINNTTRSCGCYKLEVTSIRSLKDLTGQQFGNLTVLYRDSSIGKPVSWRCKCVCGAEKTIQATNLLSGASQSCGCQKTLNAKTFDGYLWYGKDLVGERFGKFIVLEKDNETMGGNIRWICRCACGNVLSVLESSLKSGKSKSCGCYRKNFGSLHFRDLVGQRFGRLTVTKLAGFTKNQQSLWECLCDCGQVTTVAVGHLNNGHTRSCGCYVRELNAERLTTHGQSHTREYTQYKNNKRRELSEALDSEWTYAMTRALFEFAPCCAVCGMTRTEHIEKYGKTLFIDHVYPLSRGYGLKPGNAALLCIPHSTFKLNHFPEELPDELRIPIMEAAAAFADFWEEVKDVPKYL